MNPVRLFKATNPNPTRDELQELAFTFGRIRSGNGYGVMLLRRRCRKLKTAFPAFDFYPCPERDYSVTSICVDDPADWIPIAIVTEKGIEAAINAAAFQSLIDRAKSATSENSLNVSDMTDAEYIEHLKARRAATVAGGPQ
jgi:hypothetical protein